MAEVDISPNLQDNLIEKNENQSSVIPENISNSSETVDFNLPTVNNLPTCTETKESIKTDTNSAENNESMSSTKESNEEDEWLDIMGSGNFKKLVVKKGLGSETRPERGDKVTINVKYFYNNILIEEENNCQFIVGDMDVIHGLDLIICLMEREEIAKVKVPAKLAYGKIGRNPDIPPDSDIECEVEVLDIQTIDEDSLTISERLQLGEGKRLRGNYYYERTEFLDAIHCYERAAEYLEGVRDSSGSSAEESQKIVDMIIKVYNNIAASHLKLNAYQAALKSVESVLTVQPKNVKALFRKAKILGTQGSTDEAIECLKLAASLEPETKIIQVELAKLRFLKKKDEQSQKAMYKRMFPQSEPKNTPSSFSKIIKVSVVTIGLMAVVAGMAVYRQFHS